MPLQSRCGVFWVNRRNGLTDVCFCFCACCINIVCLSICVRTRVFLSVCLCLCVSGRAHGCWREAAHTRTQRTLMNNKRKCVRQTYRYCNMHIHMKTELCQTVAPRAGWGSSKIQCASARARMHTNARHSHVQTHRQPYRVSTTGVFVWCVCVVCV